MKLKGTARNSKISATAILLSASLLLLTANGKNGSVFATQKNSVPAAASSQRLIRQVEEQQLEIEKRRQRILIELEHCQNDSKIKDIEIKGLKDQIDALEKLLENQKKTIEQYQQALAKQGQVSQIDTRIIQSYEQSIKDLKDEVERLRKKYDTAMSLLKWVGTVTLLGGIAIGLAIGNK